MKLVHGLLLSSLALSGCIDSGSDSDADNSASTVNFDGKVADGYLVNAKVCLDLNNNYACDSDEPFATSSAGGAFSLSGVTQAQVDSHSVIVEVIAGETYDEDAGDPAVKIQTAYKLTAPAGSQFISPITTIVKGKMDGGLSLQESIDEVKDVLGDDFDPTTDYVAAKESNELTQTERDIYERGHKVAQVIAGLIANELDASDSLTIDDVIVSIEDKLESINTQVTSNPEDTIEDIVSDINNTVLNSTNLAGVWIGEYLNDADGNIAGAYIFNEDGSGMFLDGYEINNANCTDVEMEFNWSLSVDTLTIEYTGVENGSMSGDGAADTEILALTEFTGETLLFPPKEVQTGTSDSVTLTKKLTKSILTTAQVKSTCSAPGI